MFIKLVYVPILYGALVYLTITALIFSLLIILDKKNSNKKMSRENKGSRSNFTSIFSKNYKNNFIHIENNKCKVRWIDGVEFVEFANGDLMERNMIKI